MTMGRQATSVSSTRRDWSWWSLTPALYDVEIVFHKENYNNFQANISIFCSRWLQLSAQYSLWLSVHCQGVWAPDRQRCSTAAGQPSPSSGSDCRQPPASCRQSWGQTSHSMSRLIIKWKNDLGSFSSSPMIIFTKSIGHFLCGSHSNNIDVDAFEYG